MQARIGHVVDMEELLSRCADTPGGVAGRPERAALTRIDVKGDRRAVSNTGPADQPMNRVPPRNNSSARYEPS